MKQVLKKVLPAVLSLGMMLSTSSSVFAATTSPKSPTHTHTPDKTTEKVVKAATCTEKGTKSYVCSDCKKTYEVDVDALAHVSDAGSITTAPTAVAEGVKTYKCTRCGTVLKTEAVAKVVLVEGTNYTAESGATVTVLAGDVVSVKVKNEAKAYVTVPSTVVVNGKTYPVTTLKGDAFNGSKVKVVTLPSSITKLNAKTFAGDKKLTKINVSSKKLTIGKNLFSGISKKQKRKIKVVVSKTMSKKNFNTLKKALVKQGLKSSNIKRK